MSFLEKSRSDIQYEVINKKLDSILELIGDKSSCSEKRKWISEQEAKITLNVSSTTLWRLRNANKVVWTKSGRKTLYDLESINHYLNQNIGN